MRILFTLLAAVAASLLLAAPSFAQVGHYHQGLGDDPLPAPDSAQGVFTPPLASPTQRGCITDLISTNFSSRNGITPSMLVLHYTVSSNVAGWSDVNAIRSWFSQPRAQASSNYIIDFEGRCKLIVPETAKAWTQGAFNPDSISIEFIARGNETTWPNAGLRKGARVFADAAARYNIPIRFVDPVGCVERRGITDHESLECGNTHTDVQPHFPYSKFMRFVREAAAPPEPKNVRFVLRGPGGQKIAQSSPIPATWAGHAKYRSFVRNLADREGLRAAALQRLHRKGTVVIHREEVR